MKILQKLFMGGLIGISLGHYLFANENSNNGAFIGIYTGATIMGLSQNLFENDSNHITVYNIGFKSGYQYYFHPIVGLRGYLSYDFNTKRPYLKSLSGGGNINKLAFSYHNIALNADLLLKIFSNDIMNIGMYAGFGLGYGIDVFAGTEKKEFEKIMQTHTTYNGFNIPINLGFMFTLFNHHQIELGAKIPTLGTKHTLNDNKHKGFYVNPYVIHVGYSYIF